MFKLYIAKILEESTILRITTILHLHLSNYPCLSCSLQGFCNMVSASPQVWMYRYCRLGICQTMCFLGFEVCHSRFQRLVFGPVPYM